MAKGCGHEDGVQNRSRRWSRRRIAWGLGILSLMCVAAIVLLLRDRSEAPRGVTVVSLQALGEQHTPPTRLWPGQEPRTVHFVCDVNRRRPAIVGTAGPSGVTAEPAPLGPEGQRRPPSGVWHGDTVAYGQEGVGLCVRSPYTAAPRKLARSALGGHHSSRAWSPTGDRLAVTVTGVDSRLRGVCIYSREGDLMAETAVEGPHWPPLRRILWSPSGRRMLLWYYANDTYSDDSARRPDDEHATLLSAPDWRPVPVRFPDAEFRPVAWANDEVVVAGVGDYGEGEFDSIRFVRVPSGDEVGRVSRQDISLAEALVAHSLADIHAAPSRAGVIAAFFAVSRPTAAVDSGMRRLPRGVRRSPSVDKAARWAMRRSPVRIAYVYIPVSGTGPQQVTMGDFGACQRFTISRDGTELLYVSDWELKAAPLPVEARREGS